MTTRSLARAVGLLIAMAAAQAAAQGASWYTVAIAASHNDAAQVLTMLQSGQDPDAIDSTGLRTALDYAASFNNVAIAKILLDHQAHVDARDATGNSALHWAAERGNLEVMRYLIENQATVDFANRQGITPLMLAAGHSQPAAVKLLIQKGADPRKQDYTGRDARGWAAGSPAVLQALNTK